MRLEKSKQHIYGDDDLGSALVHEDTVKANQIMGSAQRRKVPTGYSKFKGSLIKKSNKNKLSRALWKGAFYYRDDTRTWRNKSNGRVYKSVRFNPASGEWEGIGQL